MKAAAAIATAPLMAGTLELEERDLETRQVRDGALRYRDQIADAVRRGEGASTKSAERLLAHWFSVVEAAVATELTECRAGRPGQGRQIHGPILELLPPDKLAVIGMHETVSKCMEEPSGVKYAALTYSIGRAVLAEINLDIMAKEDGELLKAMDKRFRNLSPGKVNWWAGRKIPDVEIRTRKGAVHVGAFLLKLLTELASAADYDWKDWKGSFVPAFAREVRREGKKTTAYIVMTEAAWGVIDDGHTVRSRLRPKYLPTLVQPYRWTKDAQGGYLYIRCPFISKPTPTQKRALKEAADAGQLERVWDALHAVSGTPMRFNRLVLATQRAYWESGGNGLGIPRRDPLPTPPHPPGYNHALSGKEGCWLDVDAAVKKAFKRESAAVQAENITARAARKEFLSKMAVADLFEDRERIYYPHQLCFRGRAYPIPPHLNHQCDDVARGLLEFANARPVDEEGRRELLIEAANCWGNDKLSYDDRVAWAQDHMRQVERCAKNPLDTDWWHAAEDPWQFLAMCFALTDPESAAHASVWRDGSCNGLQHFSALGRDPIGAAAVNLTPGDAPNDVYADVARAVKARVLQDAENAETLIRYRKRTRDGFEAREIPLRTLAQFIAEHINRKTCKQPVMTSVYGVTRIGASGQILGQLKDAGVTDEALHTAANYLAGRVLEGIGRVCVAAGEIMAWLRECAKVIAASGEPVAWTTPIGLCVTQPYRRYSIDEVPTVLGVVKVRVHDDTKVPVLPRRQVAGCAPNTVHGYDGSHMMFTALGCRDEGIDFAARHDAYGTHAMTCRRGGEINRREFVRMHREPLLLNLAAEWRRRYPEVDIPDPPAPGNFDLSAVLQSPYFFS